MLPSIAASRTGHWNQEGSRRWQRAILLVRSSLNHTNKSPRKLSTTAAPSRGWSKLFGNSEQMKPSGRLSSICSMRDTLSWTSMMRIQTRASPIEIAPRSAAYIAAAAVLPGKLGLKYASGDGAVLQRGGIVIELDQGREGRVDVTDELAQDLRAPRIEIGSDTARDDAIAHEPVAEAAIGGAQHALAQHAAMGVHERESGVIADRANVAEMIRQPLELRHEGAQPHGAGRRLCPAGGFGGADKSIGISNRGVARGASCEESAVRQVGARNQAFYSLVDIAETLFDPNHGLAIRSKAEMPRLDDAGMDRPDRNLMEAGPLGGQERVGHAVDGCGDGRAERMRHPPSAVIEPAARVRRAPRLVAEQIPNRAFKPDRRRVPGSDRREAAVLACQSEDSGRALLVDNSHVDVANLAP